MLSLTRKDQHRRVGQQRVPAQPGVMRSGPPPRTSRGLRHVLVVEDDSPIRLMLSDRLMEAKELGADGFLSKPFDFDVLTALVRSFTR